MTKPRPLSESDDMAKRGIGIVPGCVCDRCGHDWVPGRKRGPILQGLVQLPDKCARCKSLQWNGGVQWVAPQDTTEAVPEPVERPVDLKPAYIAAAVQSLTESLSSPRERVDPRAFWRAHLLMMTPVICTVAMVARAGRWRSSMGSGRYGRVPESSEGRRMSPWVVC